MIRPLLPAIVVTAAVGFAAVPARAEWQIGVGFDSGGHHHHHHHGHGHYNFGWWYRPYDYVYYAPRPVTYVVPMAAPVYVPAVPAVSSNAATAPPAASTAAAEVRNNALPAYRGPGVQIRNPAEIGAPVAFVVDGKMQLDLQPGQSTPLAEKSVYTVEFDRGGNFGTARRTVTEGIYEFTATDTGWDLIRREPAAGGDNLEPVVRRNALPQAR